MSYVDEHMREMGVTRKLLKATKSIRCPKCHLGFSLMYSRAVACGGCPEAVYGCGLVRCPKCSHEFSISESGLANTKDSAKSLDKYMAKTISEYLKNFGKSPRR